MSLISLLLVLLIEQFQPQPQPLRQLLLRRYLPLVDRMVAHLQPVGQRQGWLAWAIAVLLPAALSARPAP